MCRKVIPKLGSWIINAFIGECLPHVYRSCTCRFGANSPHHERTRTRTSETKPQYHKHTPHYKYAALINTHIQKLTRRIAKKHSYTHTHSNVEHSIYKEALNMPSKSMINFTSWHWTVWSIKPLVLLLLFLCDGVIDIHSFCQCGD